MIPDVRLGDAAGRRYGHAVLHHHDEILRIIGNAAGVIIARRGAAYECVVDRAALIVGIDQLREGEASRDTDRGRGKQPSPAQAYPFHAGLWARQSLPAPAGW